MKQKGLTMIETSKLIGQLWKELKNKKKFENLSAADIKRYQAELEEAENANTTPKILGKKRPAQRSVSPKVVKKQRKN